MYNWYAVNTGKLCPTDWHVPTDGEWTTLTTFLGGEPVAGGKLKETGITHWETPNKGATNETGFTTLPGGYSYSGGTYTDVGNLSYWWSSTETSATYAWYRNMYYNKTDVGSYSYNKQNGFSVRCVRVINF